MEYIAIFLFSFLLIDLVLSLTKLPVIKAGISWAGSFWCCFQVL